jgi:hypothetical protein
VCVFLDKFGLDQGRFCVRCIFLFVQAFRFVWSVVLATLRIHATVLRQERSYGPKDGTSMYRVERLHGRNLRAARFCDRCSSVLVSIVRQLLINL